MYLHLSSPAATTISIIFLIFILQLIIKKRANTSKNKNPPPQAKGAWPIIGHLHLLAGSALPHRVFGKLADTSGPIFTVKLGSRQALVVSDADMAKECFTTNDRALAGRPKSLVSVIMGYNYAMFPLTPFGDYYRKISKTTKVELLSQRRVDMLRDDRLTEVRSFMNDIHEACVRNKEVAGSATAQVEMREFFGNLVLNIVTRAVAGKRFTPGEEECVRVHEVVRVFFEYLGTFVVSDFIPYLKFLDLGGHVNGMKLAMKDMDDLIEGWLKDHKKKRESGEQNLQGKQDFMDTLMSILEAAPEDEFPGYDNDTIVKATSLVMITAGYDSSGVALTWAIVLLLNNPETLKLAREELDLHVGKERPVEESDIKNLVYIQAIVKETLRLYPPAPIGITRESTEDFIVGGYTVPKGTLFIPNVWKLHRDPNVWSEPDRFWPGRFLTDNKGIDVKGQNFQLLPFGSGRRMCVGASFALQTMHFTLARLIQGFEMAKPSKDPIDTGEVFRLTDHKATPLQVLFTPRLSSSMYRVDA